MDEFGMGSLCRHTAFGRVNNPRMAADVGYISQSLNATITPHPPTQQKPRSPGGSSGGSAAVVAAGLVEIALGSDTGGSVRLPASYCGVVGFKPSYGRCSRYGLVAYASSLDTPGVIAASVEHAGRAYAAMAGWDSKDATSSRRVSGALRAGCVSPNHCPHNPHSRHRQKLNSAISESPTP